MCIVLITLVLFYSVRICQTAPEKENGNGKIPTQAILINSKETMDQ